MPEGSIIANKIRSNVNKKQVECGLTWLEGILYPPVYEAFVDYINAELKSGTITLDDDYCEGSIEGRGPSAGYELMFGGFLWTQTEEGFLYWHDVLDGLLPLININPEEGV